MPKSNSWPLALHLFLTAVYPFWLPGYLKGQLEDRDGKVYVESASLYVVPRYAPLEQQMVWRGLRLLRSDLQLRCSGHK